MTSLDGGRRVLGCLLCVCLALTLAHCAQRGADSGGSGGPFPSGGSGGGFGGSSGGFSGSAGGSGGFGGGNGGINTNVNLGGSQDFGYFRRLLDDGIVPRLQDFDAAGFFAEHQTTLPEPLCGERICLQAMLGVMGNLVDGAPCSMLQVGLNSPIAADPGARPPLTLSVVVDVSGSMSNGGKLDFVRDGLGRLIDGLRDEDRVAILVYDDDVRVLAPMGDVVIRRAELRALVDGLVASGSTNLHDGLERGFETILESYDPSRQNRVILLSDGEPTAGITDPETILAMSGGYNSEGVGITTIGLGTAFNYDLMSRLARQGDGNFYFLEDSSAVAEVFGEELSYFTVPVAYDLSMNVRVGPKYAFGRAYGSPLFAAEEDGGTLEVPSVFLAHRESADDVTEEGDRRGGGSALLIEVMARGPVDDAASVDEAVVATLELTFRDPTTDAMVEDRIEVVYPHAPWEVPTEGHFDSANLAIVQKSFVMLNIYVGFQRASELFHDGEPEAAVSALERLIAAVEDYHDGIEGGDEDIRQDLLLLEQMRDVIGWSIPGPIEPTPLPEDPWPAD